MEGNDGGPEKVSQPQGESQPEGGGLSPSSKEVLSALSQAGGEALRQAAQTSVQPGEIQSTPSNPSPDASKPGNLAEERSSNQPLNMTQLLQEEFGLTAEQLTTLKKLAQQKGINLEQFSEGDLGNKEKMQQVLSLLENEEVKLSEQQKKNLKDIQQQLQQADQPLTQEQMQAKINEKKQQLQSRMQELQQKQQSGQVLTDEEKKELDEIQQALPLLTDMESQVGQLSADQSPEAKVQKRQTLLEKAPTYFKYAGFGLAALFFIFAWRGLTSEMGGQRGGMMG